MYEEHDEHEEARRLLAPLASEPTRPSTVDLRRAMADGRRRLRTRRLAGVGAVAAATALVVAGVPAALAAVRAPDGPPVASTATPTTTPSPSPTGPVPPTECELVELAEGEGAYQSVVTAADPTGRFIGGRFFLPVGTSDGNLGPETSVLPVIWHGDEPVAVDIPGDDPVVTDVNSRGAAVGTSLESYEESESAVSWIYQDGRVSRLAGENAAVSAINEQGVVVGTQGSPARPVVWRSPTAQPEELSIPAGDWASFRGTEVDDSGTIVGTGHDLAALPDESPDRPFVWLPDGTRQEIPAPTVNGEPALGFRAETIHDGVTTGLALVAPGLERPFRYELATGEFTDLDPGIPIATEAWSGDGWVVGYTSDELVIVTGSAVVPLPYPRTPDYSDDSSLSPPTVAAVSDDGLTVTGQIYDEEGNAHAAAWYCR
jgi:uncharacterized membrane protein